MRRSRHCKQSSCLRSRISPFESAILMIQSPHVSTGCFCKRPMFVLPLFPSPLAVLFFPSPILVHWIPQALPSPVASEPEQPPSEHLISKKGHLTHCSSYPLRCRASAKNPVICQGTVQMCKHIFLYRTVQVTEMM